MSDLDTELVKTLHAVADDEVHLERFLAETRAVGMRYRRRRRLVGAAGAGVCLVVLVGIGTTLAQHRAGSAPPIGTAPSAATARASNGAPSASPSRSGPTVLTVMPQLPPVSEAGSILTHPKSVGTAPFIHVSFDALPVPAAAVQWSVGAGGERLNIDGQTAAGGIRTTLAASLDGFMPLDGKLSQVSIGGQPARLSTATRPGDRTTVVRWEPAPGLHLEVVTTLDGAATLKIAQTLRLDRGYRCAVPFRLVDVPSGTVLSSCGTEVNSGSATGGATVAMGDASVTIDLRSRCVNRPNETIGGHPAQTVEHSGDGGHQIMELSVDLGGDRCASMTAEGPYDAAAVRRLAAGIVAEPSSDLRLWPANPLVG